MAQTFNAVTVENGTGLGRFMLVCEHASNAFPDAFGDLGIDADTARSHVAWDPGALALARALSERLDAVLIHAGVSRLIQDLNRPPHSASAMPERSELYLVPGNRDLPAAERLRRTREIYIPFHARVAAELAQRLARGEVPAFVTVHSFTPVYFGQPRSVEIGFIHDGDPSLAESVLDRARVTTGHRCELNAPYSAADGVAHTLRLHATPYGLRHVMIEVRNDLLADDTAVARIADGLAEALRRALDWLEDMSNGRETV